MPGRACEEPVLVDSEQPLGLSHVRARTAEPGQRLRRAADQRLRIRARHHPRPASRCGRRLPGEHLTGSVVSRPDATRPERRVCASAVPRQRDVDVAGVRVGAGVGMPATVVAGPHHPVVDEVHHAEPVGHLARPAARAVAGQPAEKVPGDPAVGEVAVGEHPVPGSSVLVLRGSPGRACPGCGRAVAAATVGRQRQCPQRGDAAGRRRDAGQLRLVARCRVDRRSHRAGRRQPGRMRGHVDRGGTSRCRYRAGPVGGTGCRRHTRTERQRRRQADETAENRSGSYRHPGHP